MKHLTKLFVISIILLSITITIDAQTPAKSYLKKECKGCDKADSSTQPSSDFQGQKKEGEKQLTDEELKELIRHRKSNNSQNSSTKESPKYTTSADKKLAKATKREYTQPKPLTKEEKLAEIKKLEWQISQLDASSIPNKTAKLLIPIYRLIISAIFPKH